MFSIEFIEGVNLTQKIRDWIKQDEDNRWFDFDEACTEVALEEGWRYEENGDWWDEDGNRCDDPCTEAYNNQIGNAMLRRIMEKLDIESED